MDRKLNHLRRHMIAAKLNHLDFSERSKQEVLEKIKDRKTRFKPSVMWKSGLSATGCMALLIGGISIAVNHPDTKFQAGKTQSHGTSINRGHVVAAEPKGQHYPPIKDPGPLTKEEIVNRMLNTPDYFMTAQGSYIFMENNRKTIVQYEVLNKEGKKFRSYCKSTIPSVDSSDIEIVNGTNLIKLYSKSKTYMKTTVTPYYKGSPVTINSIFSTGKDGIQTFAPRNRPPVGRAFNSLFPYEEAGSFLRDSKRWEIVKQDTEVAGQKAVEVKGTSNRHDIKTFKFWISKATGILLEMKFYNSQGNVINSIQTTKIQLNKPVDLSNFVIHVPKGYQDELKIEAEQMKPDPRAKKIKTLYGAKEGGKGSVQKVFQEVKAHVPFLYKFNGSDIFLDSAGLYKYEQYYQTTLAYIPDYRRNHVAKKGTSQFLFVREHNRNSFVRQKGVDFVSSEEFKKHQKKSFTLNGIDWKGYTINRRPNFPETYITGTKGNYVYEVVGQDLSFEKVKECLKSFKKD